MINWTDAFDNSGYVPGSDKLAEAWSAAAALFRETALAKGRGRLDLLYGARPRNRFDLFLPEGVAKGLIVFVHGGYWQRLDKSYWSHFADPGLQEGWAVAIPSYTLAPDARISEIVAEIGAAVTAAAGEVSGPIRLIGHSAGGHLVARMACQNAPLDMALRARLDAVIAVSGIHDLRPLLLSQMNEVLHLSEAEATAESPACLAPNLSLPITLWVGAAERPELLRQTRLLGEIWGQKGALTREVFQPSEDHFSVIAALANPDSALTQTLTAIGRDSYE